MIEVKGNIWDYWGKGWIVITTNGTIRKDGAVVMGRGLAHQCKERFPEFPYLLGDHIRKYGNKLMPYLNRGLIAFPVKHNWWEMADLDLIEKSCQELTEWNNLGIATPIPIYLPRPGCENGRRDWETEVKPILLRYLTSDQYTVVDLKG